MGTIMEIRTETVAEAIMDNQNKDTYILAIESSCDETAAAVVKNGREVMSNVISSQIALHTLYGGVVPEIASRKHIEKINQVIEEALKEATAQIVEAIHSVLEKTPPELAADIADRGIVLTGGGSLLQGLEELIEEKTGINTMTAEDPMTAVAIGTGRFIEFLAGER